MTLNFQSITFRIVALGVGLSLIGFAVRLFIALPMVQKDVRDTAAAQQLALASHVAQDVDHDITARLGLIERFAAELPPSVAANPARLQAWIKDRQRINPLFNSGLMAVRPDGNGLLAAYPSFPGRRARDYSSSSWFAAALQSSRPVLGKPAREPASGNPVIVFAAPVRDAAGKVVTVLAGVAALDSPEIFDHFQGDRPDATGLLLVSPQDALFVTSSEPAMILMPTPPAGIDLLHDRAMTGYRGAGITTNANGVEELSAMVTVPSTGWFVVARVPTADAFRAVKGLRSFMQRASLVLLVVILAILLIGLPRILRPLTDAARTIRNMADGKTALAPLPIIRDDEVGKLLRGFNFLVERLHHEEAARAASEAQLKFMAHHDSLTGLFNRAILEDRLEQALARAERDGSQVALLFCDLDGFKSINDQHGHGVGDEVLRQVASRLTDGRRQVDTVARVGGDEFVILLSGLSDARAAATVVAEQCLAAIGEPFKVEEKTLALGVSIGIATHTGPAVAPSYLIAQADFVMYRAKRQRTRGGTFFFTEELMSGDLA